MTRYAIRAVREDEREAVGRALAALERETTYPLGNERFRIDHGADYFRFFARLADPAARPPLRTWIAQRDDGAIDGTLTAVRRRIVLRPGEALRVLDYLCDLKVRPRAGGARLARRLFEAYAREALGETGAAYGISMDPAGERASNPLALVAARAALARVAGQLLLYRFDARAAREVERRLEPHVGPVRWLSLRSIKDLVLEPSRRVLDLLHAQYGAPAPQDAELQAPREGATHMLCVPAGGAVANALRAHEPAASATILALGEAPTRAADYGFVRTSEI